jgi:hypothetical protein
VKNSPVEEGNVENSPVEEVDKVKVEDKLTPSKKDYLSKLSLEDLLTIFSESSFSSFISTSSSSSSSSVSSSSS